MENKKNQCSATRAQRYASRAEARDAILETKIKAATNGARGDLVREEEICEDCGGWHVVTRARRERGARR